MTFDYESSRKTLARIHYEELEDLDDPVLVLDAVRRSGVGPDRDITITSEAGRRTVIVPKCIAQDWLNDRNERVKAERERESLTSKIFRAGAGYVLVACVLVTVAAPLSILLPDSLYRLPWLKDTIRTAFLAATAILLLAGWWMSRSWKKFEEKKFEKERRRRATLRH
jgi:hypothetical protein